MNIPVERKRNGVNVTNMSCNFSTDKELADLFPPEINEFSCKIQQILLR